MTNILTNELLEHLTTLSKLELTDSTKTELCKDLEQMLSYVDKISELPLDGIRPLTHFPECTSHFDVDLHASTDSFLQPSAGLREDIPYPTAHPKQLVALAPKQTDSYYVVPNSLQSNKA